MSESGLYAYVDGDDLEHVAPDISSALLEFVRSREWIVPGVVVVDTGPSVDSFQSMPEDLPEWDLGLNLPLPQAGKEPNGWFSDVEAIALFLATLALKTGREFVIGIADNGRGISEDLAYVDGAAPDLETLRAVIGVGNAG